MEIWSDNRIYDSQNIFWMAWSLTSLWWLLLLLCFIIHIWMIWVQGWIGTVFGPLVLSIFWSKVLNCFVDNVNRKCSRGCRRKAKTFAMTVYFWAILGQSTPGHDIYKIKSVPWPSSAINRKWQWVLIAQTLAQTSPSPKGLTMSGKLEGNQVNLDTTRGKPEKLFVV